jgi:hypothetical protein
VTDLQTGIYKSTTYHQDFPYVGLVDSATKTLGGQMLNQTTSTYQVRNSNEGAWVSAPTVAAAPYRVSLASSYDASWDLDGTWASSLYTAYQYDAFGNPTQIAAWTGDGASKMTVNTYSNDTVNWFLGRLVRATVTSSQ